MSRDQPFTCAVPGCGKATSRIPHVCTRHFIEGWGRLEDMPLPEESLEKAPLYVSDKDREKGKK